MVIQKREVLDRFISRCPVATAPVKKVRIQLLGSMSPDVKKPSFPALLTHMVRTEGIGSVYAGLSASIMRQAIYGTARIGLHRSFSNKLVEVRSPEVWIDVILENASFAASAVR